MCIYGREEGPCHQRLHCPPCNYWKGSSHPGFWAFIYYKFSLLLPKGGTSIYCHGVCKQRQLVQPTATSTSVQGEKNSLMQLKQHSLFSIWTNKAMCIGKSANWRWWSLQAGCLWLIKIMDVHWPHNHHMLWPQRWSSSCRMDKKLTGSPWASWYTISCREVYPSTTRMKSRTVKLHIQRGFRKRLLCKEHLFKDSSLRLGSYSRV